jgi:hypothetical protein
MRARRDSGGLVSFQSMLGPAARMTMPSRPSTSFLDRGDEIADRPQRHRVDFELAEEVASSPNAGPMRTANVPP